MSDSVRVADYIFSFMAEQGVRAVFLVPGGGSMFLVDGIAQNSEIEFVPNHHEQASAIAAEAYARVSGGLGVAVVTTGPGATNAITGVAGAWLESAPVFIFSGQVKRSDLAGDSGLRQRGPQEIDIVPMVASITKYAITVMEPSEIRYHLEKALHLATTGRRGPVWIDIPLDVQASRIEPDALVGYVSPTDGTASRDAHLDAKVRTVIGLLNAAERPVLMAGHGVRLAGASDAFRELYERLNIPVAVTWPALDLIPSSHPLSVGKPGTVAQRSSNFAVQNSDLLITVGVRLDNSVTAFNTPNFGRNARKVIVDVDPAELAKFEMPVEVSIEADAGAFIRSMLEQADLIDVVDRSAWHARCAAWKRRYPVNEGKIFPESGPISHYHITDALSSEIPEDTLVVTGSSGLAVEFFYTGFQPKAGQRVMHTAGLGAMGYGLPAMVGAGVAYGRPFVGIESDGSLMFNLQELLTVRALDIPVRLFILNNGGYASIRNTQRNYFAGRYVGTGPEAKLLLADFVAFAETIGIPAMRITDAADLNANVRYALQQPGPFLCDVLLEPNEALWPKSAAIPMPDGTMTSMPLEDMSPLLSRAELRENMLGPLDPASERVGDEQPTTPR